MSAAVNVNECPVCRGTGYVLDSHGSSVTVLSERKVCERCDGRGILDMIWEKGSRLGRRKLGSKPVRPVRVPVVAECPCCLCVHTVSLARRRSDSSDPSEASVDCKCGAELLVIGEPKDFEVIWWNQKKMQQALWLKTKPKLRPGWGGYYDLVRVPHGHVPVTKIHLWRGLPIPVKEFRSNNYFKCPECGSLSFFKIDISCQHCAFGLDLNTHEEYLRARDRFFNRWQRRDRKEYFRRLWKRLDCLVLPLLVVLGKAWYVRSERQRWQRGR